MLYELIAVFAGGGIGAVLRYLMTLCAGKCFGMPYVGTFVVNIAGCFAIGYIFGLTLNKTALLPQHLKLFISALLIMKFFLFLKTEKLFTVQVICC